MYLYQFQPRPTKPISYDLAECFVSQPILRASTAPPGRRNGPHPVETLDLSGERLLVHGQDTKAELGKDGQISPLYSIMPVLATIHLGWDIA